MPAAGLSACCREVVIPADRPEGGALSSAGECPGDVVEFLTGSPLSPTASSQPPPRSRVDGTAADAGAASQSDGIGPGQGRPGSDPAHWASVSLSGKGVLGALPTLTTWGRTVPGSLPCLVLAPWNRPPGEACGATCLTWPVPAGPGQVQSCLTQDVPPSHAGPALRLAGQAGRQDFRRGCPGSGSAGRGAVRKPRDLPRERW